MAENTSFASFPELMYSNAAAIDLLGTATSLVRWILENQNKKFVLSLVAGRGLGLSDAVTTYRPNLGRMHWEIVAARNGKKVAFMGRSFTTAREAALHFAQRVNGALLRRIVLPAAEKLERDIKSSLDLPTASNRSIMRTLKEQNINIGASELSKVIRKLRQPRPSECAKRLQEDFAEAIAFRQACNGNLNLDEKKAWTRCVIDPREPWVTLVLWSHYKTIASNFSKIFDGCDFSESEQLTDEIEMETAMAMRQRHMLSNHNAQIQAARKVGNPVLDPETHQSHREIDAKLILYF